MRRLPSVLLIALITCVLFMGGSPTAASPSFQTSQTFHDDTLGVTFQYPAGWQVQTQAATQTLIVSSAEDQKAQTNGQAPTGLIFSLTFSTFRQVGADQVGDFSARLQKITGSTDSLPHAARIGGADGLSIDLTDTTAGIAGRSAMLSIGLRRVAVVRGVAVISVWAHDAQAQYDALISTLSFTPPANAASEDHIGRALWQVSDPKFGTFADIGATADGSSVLVTDSKNGVWTLGANGTLSGLKAYDGIGAYGSIALFRDGTRYIADPVNHAVWVIQANGIVKKLLGGTVGNTRGTFGATSPRVFSFGYSNTLNILDNTDKGTRIQVYGRGGDILTSWDIDPVEDGALATDPNGYVYVVGKNLAGVLKIAANGKVMAKDLGKSALAGTTPLAIEVDRFGNLYIATADSGVIKLDASGALQGIIGEPYDETAPPKAGQIGKPVALALAQDGNILYIADAGKYPQVVAMALNGNAAINVTAGTKAMGSISYGQAVNGQITPEAFVNIYTFDGKAGDLVTITMRAADGSSLDPFVDLIASDGTRVAVNDDAPPTLGLGKGDAQITSFKLPYKGTYTIRATRFGRETTNGTGSYTLTLDNK